MECFLALGGNFANTRAAFRRTIGLLEQVMGINEIVSSRLYQTSAVSPFPQADYLNAVLRFQTSLRLSVLKKTLEGIENILGKEPKKKEQPRLIDLDLLFFGKEMYEEEGYSIPHPHWSERLFVLMPLRDVVHEHSFPSKEEVEMRLLHFTNIHQERVTALSEKIF